MGFREPFESEQGGSGVTDHGALTGLADDDHPQYHTDARGDARYVRFPQSFRAGLDAGGLWTDPDGLIGGAGLDAIGFYVEVAQ